MSPLTLTRSPEDLYSALVEEQVTVFSQTPAAFYALQAVDALADGVSSGWFFDSLAATLWVFWAWARRIMPDNRQEYFWRTTTIYLATPIFWLMTTMAFASD